MERKLSNATKKRFAFNGIYGEEKNAKNLNPFLDKMLRNN